MKNKNTILKKKSGYTLVEVMMASSLGAIVIAGVFGITLTCMRMWHSGDVYMKSVLDSSMVMEYIVYGVGTNGGLREASSVSISTATNGWSIAYTNADNTACTINYNSGLSNLTVQPSGKLLSDDISYAPTPNFTGTGVEITLDVAKTRGKFSATNRVSTFVKFRNL